MSPPRALLVTLALALACGCEAEPDPVDSGLPADALGQSLSESEQQQLCDAWADYLDRRTSDAELRQFWCAAESIRGWENSFCSDEYRSCREDEDLVPRYVTCAEPIDWSTCTATVAEIERCFTAKADRFIAAGKALKPCSPPSEGNPGSDPCAEWVAECPALTQAVAVFRRE